MGNRLQPFTEAIPKPLAIIDGIPIIERQILFLKAVGIAEINIVTGYKSEMFQYLENKHKVSLIFNPEYKTFNNIYSLFLCRDLLKNTWILEGDVFLNRNFLMPAITTSTYFSIFKSDISNEWILEFSPKERLKQIIIPDETLVNTTYKTGAYVMSGVSYWDDLSTDIIKCFLDDLMHMANRKKGHSVLHFYWDQIIKENIGRLNIMVQKLKNEDCYEIDTVGDLNFLMGKMS